MSLLTRLCVRGRMGPLRSFSSAADVTYPRRGGVAAVSFADAPVAATSIVFSPSATAIPDADDVFAADFDNASPGSVRWANGGSGRRLIVKIPAKDASLGDVRSAAVAAVATARKVKGVGTVAFDVSALATEEAKEAAVQAVVLSNYEFDAYLSPEVKEKKGPLLRDIVRACV